MSKGVSGLSGTAASRRRDRPLWSQGRDCRLRLSLPKCRWRLSRFGGPGRGTIVSPGTNAIDSFFYLKAFYFLAVGKTVALRTRIRVQPNFIQQVFCSAGRSHQQDCHQYYESLHRRRDCHFSPEETRTTSGAPRCRSLLRVNVSNQVSRLRVHPDREAWPELASMQGMPIARSLGHWPKSSS